MTNQKIYPVILCGGGGTRLWPLSRKSLPKPFLPLVRDETLFEQAVRRVSEDNRFAPITVVAGQAHADLIVQQLHGVPDAKIVIEPSAQNTAPAIALAAAILPEDAIMLVCPSDHHIADPVAFSGAAVAAAELAREDYLVSFGIQPDSPETGFGYLEKGSAISGGYEIARFVEKPDLATAEEYLKSGRFSWNGGIFAFRAGKLMDEILEHRPAMGRLVKQSVDQGQYSGITFHPAAAPFAAIEGESIDYAVMENSSKVAMVPADMGWSDIGNWAALADAFSNAADEQGNVARGSRADFDQCRSVFTSSDGPRISAIGLEDVCIIVSGDEVLVTTRDGAQRVGKLPGAVNQ